MSKIVFKCEDKDCPHPDVVVADPVDDNERCPCGKTRWGHFKNKAKGNVEPCGWCGSTNYVIVDDGYGSWPYCSCCGGN